MTRQENQSFSNQVLSTASAFQASRALLTAVELDIFTQINSQKLPSKELAEKMNCHPRALDRLLNALCSLGFLGKEDGLFFNTDEGRSLLCADSKDYMAGLMHMAHLWDSWGDLTAVVKNGPSPEQDLSQMDEKWFAAFISAMHWRAKSHAPHLAGLLKGFLNGRILDVGGGSGIYTAAMLKESKEASAVIFDLPPVVEMTRKYLADAGLNNRAQVVAGNYLSDLLPAGFDLVFLSAIIHINGPEENQDLVARCAQALNPGGRLAVVDFIMEPNRTAPRFGALFALNMLTGTPFGDTYTMDEIRLWMEKAGLEFEGLVESGGNTGMVMGKKV
ncbi:MAG: methyltransferase [Desulfatibacillaceae bacterium]|nr:methyltransferase [Desulfatibacillaceae bacterium]